MSDTGSNNANAYQGAQDQSSNLTDVNSLKFMIRQELAEVRTAVPFKIIKAPYDKDGNPIQPGSPVPIGYVDVQPMVNQLDGYGNSTEHGTVYRLSYHRTQGGGNAIICDPQVGDIGQGIINDRDTSSVRRTNDIANPGSRRKFDLADGIYHGSVQQSGTLTQWVAFQSGGMQLHDMNSNIITTTSGGITIEAAAGKPVVINGATITSTGDIITAHGTSLDHHVNTEVMSGPDNTGPPP